MTIARSHKGSARPTTLAGPISNVDGTFTVTAGGGSGYPDGATGKFVVTLDAGVVGEEKILCVSRSSDTFTVDTRGYDDTAAASHPNGASVLHTYSAIEAQEANDHIVATAGAHAASAVTNTPAGTIAATTVQAALNELDTEKVPWASVGVIGHAEAASTALWPSGDFINTGAWVDTDIAATFTAPPSGKVTLDVRVFTHINGGNIDLNARIGYHLTGATTITADDARSVEFEINNNAGYYTFPTVTWRFFLTGLTPGGSYTATLAAKGSGGWSMEARQLSVEAA